MEWKRWVGSALVTAVGAWTILEGQHVVLKMPHVEVEVPPPSPKMPPAVAATGSGPLLGNVYNTTTATYHVIAGKVFIIRW